jgi:hypothetical protein
MQVSRWTISTGTTGTAMSEGWSQYSGLMTSNYDSMDRTANVLSCPGATGTNDTFSSSGQCVAWNVRSVRNRDNVYQKTVWIYYYIAGASWVPANSVTFTEVGWKGILPTTAEAIRW